MEKVVEKHRRNLPHFQREGQIISLTWRLAFSLPREMLIMQKGLSDTLMEIRNLKGKDKSELLRSYNIKLHKLDAALAKCRPQGFSLCDDGIGKMICDTFYFYSGKLYQLHCFCLMPNHVHLLIRPLKDTNGIYIRVSNIVRTLKGYTSKQINDRLDRSGKIWNPDYFDRYIRDPGDYYSVVGYILKNPVAADIVKNQVDWKYSFYQQGLIE